jgi:hypothetical protein
MRRRWFGPGTLALLWLCGCATGPGPGPGDTLKVGQRLEELVARQGQPQEVQPGPGGGKIYVYTRDNLDQTAALGGGAWVKPDQVYYHINDQGVITQVQHYPYGKHTFLMPAKEKPVQASPAPPAPTPAPGPGGPAPPPAAAAPTTPEPQILRAPAAAPATPPAATAGRAADGASRLELNMSKEEVRRVLGPPEGTEGFRAGGRGVIVWTYWLTGPAGRGVLTPLVFEAGRLSGWGENYYRRRLREIPGQQP